MKLALFVGVALVTAIERYIALRYARRHGARIERFSPWLLAVLANGRPAAALGLRCPGGQPLTLETYLDRPLELLLAERLQQPVARPQIVEVGNLAASDHTARRLLFAALVTLLASTGHRWLACTATAKACCWSAYGVLSGAEMIFRRASVPRPI